MTELILGKWAPLVSHALLLHIEYESREVTSTTFLIKPTGRLPIFMYRLQKNVQL